MNEQTLEMQIHAQSQSAIKSLNKLVSTLTKVEKKIDSIDKSVNDISTNKANAEMKKLDNSVNKTSKSMLKLQKLFTFDGIKKITKTGLSWINEAIDYSEQLNLFNVVFDNIEKNGTTMYSNLGKKAIRFQHDMNEAFGTNKTQSLYMQGIFQSMGETVGIGDTYASVMSETMTKLTYDLASLFNKNENNIAEAIRAGAYAGQTKPLRSYGIDVTQSSLAPIAKQLGIERSVSEMSQAEKEILRYLATLNQAKNAMGDLANTIESPSNQIKVFRQQLIETKVALTSLFIGTFSNIIPYLNAGLIVVKEVSKAVATMFGIELTDYNSGLASQEGIYDGLEESAENATQKVKELKRQTLGFDEIHNLDDNKDNNSSTSGGIDKRLLDAITGYDNGMDKVKMKATEIRDRIMEWLGFTQEIDPLTGQISFKLKDGYSNLKLIGSIVALLVGFKIAKGLTDIAKSILGVNSLLTLSGDNLTTVGKIVKSLKTSGWKATIGNISASLKTALPVLGKVAVGFGGIAGVIFGSKGAYSGMKSLVVESDNTVKSLGKMTLGIGEAAAGGALLGSVIPGVGTLIGALSGAVVGLTASLFGYKAGIEQLAKDDLFGTISISTANWVEMLNNLDISINDNTERFSTLQNDLLSLGKNFDDNADKLDLYGLKFGQLAHKITEKDSVNINKAIQDMCNSSSSIIDSTTTYNLELWGTTFTRMSTLTEEEEQDILNSILNYGEQQKLELKSAQDNITTTYDNAIKTRGYLTDAEYTYIQQQLQKIRELTNSEMSLSQSDIKFYKTLFADENQKLDEESYSNYKKALDQYHTERLQAIEETYNQELNSAQNLLDKHSIKEKEYNDLLKTAYEQRNADTIELDKELAKHTDAVIESLKIKYGQILDDNSTLGKEQKKIIENIFKDLNIDVSEVERSFRDIGKSCAVDFSSVFSDNLTVDGSKLYSTWNSTLSKFDSKFPSNNFNLPLNNPFAQFKLNADGGVFSNGNWRNIKQYANGGFPTHGSAFIAGEHGPEIVGHINRKTEVLNQSQIASAIYNAMMNAMSQFGGQYSEIDVHVHTDEGTIIDRIEQKTKQTGQFPFTIPTY